MKAMNQKTVNDSMFLIQHDTTPNAATVTRALLENMKPEWKAVPLVECMGHSMDDAYQFPDEIKYHDNHIIAHGGCMISGPGTCITAKPFNSKSSCFAAVSDYRHDLTSCHRQADKLERPPRAHCLHGEKLVNELEHFCNICGHKAHQKPCDSHEIIRKDPHPEIYSTSSTNRHGFTSGASSMASSSLLSMMKALVKQVVTL